MKFGEELTRFYALGSSRFLRFYYPGLSRNPQGDTYERELDKVMSQVSEALGNDIRTEKIGITLSRDIAAQRGDIGVIVDDFLKLDFDGLLFIPRPQHWAYSLASLEGYQSLVTRKSDMVNELLAYLQRRSSLGVIAFNLEADLGKGHMANLLEFLTTNSGFEAEHVFSPSWDSKEHLLVRHNTVH